MTASAHLPGWRSACVLMDKPMRIEYQTAIVLFLAGCASPNSLANVVTFHYTYTTDRQRPERQRGAGLWRCPYVWLMMHTRHSQLMRGQQSPSLANLVIRMLGAMAKPRHAASPYIKLRRPRALGFNSHIAGNGPYQRSYWGVGHCTRTVRATNALPTVSYDNAGIV